MSPEQEPPPDLSAEDGPDPAVLLTESRRTARRLLLIRLLLLGLSSAGVVGAALLWAAGHGGLGLRVIAGDLLMILFVLLLF